MSYDLIALVILVVFAAVSGDKCTFDVTGVRCEAHSSPAIEPEKGPTAR